MASVSATLITYFFWKIFPLKSLPRPLPFQRVWLVARMERLFFFLPLCRLIYWSRSDLDSSSKRNSPSLLPLRPQNGRTRPFRAKNEVFRKSSLIMEHSMANSKTAVTTGFQRRLFFLAITFDGQELVGFRGRLTYYFFCWNWFCFFVCLFVCLFFCVKSRHWSASTTDDGCGGWDGRQRRK